MNILGPALMFFAQLHARKEDKCRTMPERRRVSLLPWLLYTYHMNMHESGEMYLETILRLSESRSIVRSIDVAQAMNFSKPSVSRAMKNLREAGYISVDQSTGEITLLSKGRVLAEKIYERHRVITESLEYLGVPHERAQEDACRIEHVISDESFAALKNHLNEHREKK